MKKVTNSGQFQNGNIPHTFGKHRSEETKEKLRQANLGKVTPEEIKRKISLACKKSNSGQFKKGQTSHNKGKTSETSESILSASVKRLGKKQNCKPRECPFCGKISTAQAIGHHINWTHLGKENPMKGRKHTEESKLKNSISCLGRIPWNKGLPKEKQPRYGIKATQQEIDKRRRKVLGQQRVPREKRKCHYCNKEFIVKISSKKYLCSHLCQIIAVAYPAQKNKPTKPELELLSFLHFVCPNQWRYVGDGKFWISNMNPDFIKPNTNMLIELFGEYWHKGENPQNRIDLFKKYGFNCLVIWENELKDKTTLETKIIKYNRRQIKFG